MNKVSEKYEENKKKNEIIEVHCIECKRKTRHKIVTSYDCSGSETNEQENWSIDWTSSHQVIQCQGCMACSFRQTNWFSEDAFQLAFSGGEDAEGTILYPKRSVNTLPTRDFLEVPKRLRRIYRETIDCFNNDSFTLAAAGLRAIVEGLCAEMGVTDGPKVITKNDGTTEVKRFASLECKITGLHEKGFLTEKNANVLHEHRYLGNNAIHELDRPSRDELALAIDVIEHAFEVIYEIPHKGEELKYKRARREKKA